MRRRQYRKICRNGPERYRASTLRRATAGVMKGCCRSINRASRAFRQMGLTAFLLGGEINKLNAALYDDRMRRLREAVAPGPAVN